MNLKIKFRESFRPFAPIVLRERCPRVLRARPGEPVHAAGGTGAPSGSAQPADRPRTATSGSELLNVQRSTIPAVTHVDYSARVQTVDRSATRVLHRLLRDFETATGCPVLVNTCFNVRGEPIVCTPEDAYRCFMRTDIDLLVIGYFVLDKNDQPKWPGQAGDWRDQIPLD